MDSVLPPLFVKGHVSHHNPIKFPWGKKLDDYQVFHDEKEDVELASYRGDNWGVKLLAGCEVCHLRLSLPPGAED